MVDSLPSFSTVKVGVVLLRAGQTTLNEALANRGPGPSSYERLVRSLGSMVRTKRCPGFLAGLDRRDDADGTHAIVWEGLGGGTRVVFHVATMIQPPAPPTTADPATPTGDGKGPIPDAGQASAPAAAPSAATPAPAAAVAATAAAAAIWAGKAGRRLRPRAVVRRFHGRRRHRRARRNRGSGRCPPAPHGSHWAASRSGGCAGGRWARGRGAGAPRGLIRRGAGSGRAVRAAPARRAIVLPRRRQPARRRSFRGAGLRDVRALPRGLVGQRGAGPPHVELCVEERHPLRDRGRRHVVERCRAELVARAGERLAPVDDEPNGREVGLGAPTGVVQHRLSVVVAEAGVSSSVEQGAHDSSRAQTAGSVKQSDAHVVLVVDRNASAEVRNHNCVVVVGDGCEELRRQPARAFGCHRRSLQQPRECRLGAEGVVLVAPVLQHPAVVGPEGHNPAMAVCSKGCGVQFARGSRLSSSEAAARARGCT
mmetsp:Transcript_24468/g.92430  ORF Transcript_24468/g.92430 Transcript_24468/m.92430 type:complete len:482 (+) Transcript_24468:132-1577(+)